MTTSIRVLAVAFVAVVAAYFGAMLLVQRSVRVIDTDAARISRDAASLLAQDLVDYNVVVAESAAQRIEAVRSRGSRIAWQLATLCALLAAVAALATVRVMRQVQRVQQPQRSDAAQGGGAGGVR